MPGPDPHQTFCPRCHRHFADPNVQFCRYDGAVLQPLEALHVSWIGRIVNDEYRVIRLLGSGADSEVYEAAHTKLGTRVALKLLRLGSSVTALERFRQEVTLSALASHPNLVAIEGFGSLADTTSFVVMELLSGRSLESLLAQGSLNEQTTLDFALQLCDGLAAAHEKRLVHRALKPGNVYLHQPHLMRRVQVKILNLGLSKQVTDEQRTNLTRTGTLFGTPEYLSPEQALGGGLDARTDLYALGIMLYEMLFGIVPFSAPSFSAVLNKHLTEPLLWPTQLEHERQLNPGWKDLILSLVAKQPDDRPSKVSVVKLKLQQIAEGLPALADTLPPPRRKDL